MKPKKPTAIAGSVTFEINHIDIYPRCDYWECVGQHIEHPNKITVSLGTGSGPAEALYNMMKKIKP